MTRLAVLLRGVNLGPHKRVGMKDLRDVLTAAGYEDVETYLQSGNVLLAADAGAQPAVVERDVEARLAEALGVEVRVLVRTARDLAAVVAANPWPDLAGTEPAKLHVAFLSAGPDKRRLAAIDAAAFAPDELRPGRRALYLRYPNGAGRSKLTNQLIERRLEGTATARNWNTVTALLERAGG